MIEKGQEMELEAEEIIDIEPGGKYIIVLRGLHSLQEVKDIESGLKDWLESNDTFLIMNGDYARIVRVNR